MKLLLCSACLICSTAATVMYTATNTSHGLPTWTWQHKTCFLPLIQPLCAMQLRPMQQLLMPVAKIILRDQTQSTLGTTIAHILLNEARNAMSISRLTWLTAPSTCAGMGKMRAVSLPRLMGCSTTPGTPHREPNFCTP